MLAEVLAQGIRIHDGNHDKGAAALGDDLAAVVAEWLESDEVVEVVRSAFRGDDYEENAMGAAQEGEWSWFGWLATQQLAILAAHAKGEAS